MSAVAARPAEEVIAAIGRAALLPVLRAQSFDTAARLAEELVAAALPALELTATTPQWDELLRLLRGTHRNLLLGMGTVTTASDAERAVEAGADFLVSPHPASDVRAVARETGILFIEGGFSPGEIAHAATAGPAKVFPASIGGPAYIRSLLAVLPGARLVPTGGVRFEDVPAYLDAGAFAVGIGTGLLEADAAARARALLEQVEYTRKQQEQA